MIDWSHEKYSEFIDFRIEPNIDLISKITIDLCSIVDFGSGVGDCSTIVLQKKYPHASIIGVDSSSKIIEKARANQSINAKWVCSSIEEFNIPNNAELIYIGSTFQWVENHRESLPELIDRIPQGAILAIQMPNMFNEPFYTSIIKIANNPIWMDKLRGQLRKNPILHAIDYSMLLSPITSSAKVWESTYYHTLKGHNSLLEWAKGAPLRPLYNLLNTDELKEFMRLYNAQLKSNYIYKENMGILPFKRVFILCKK